jgi:hypothetical protein
MFNMSSNVISASASAINAMRGVNAAPPWMQQGGEAEEQPFWMTMATEAAKVVLGSGVLTGGNPALGQAAGQIATMPVRRRQLPGPGMGHPGHPGAHQHPAMAHHPGADLGYDQYLEGDEYEGDYDGFYADEGDMLEEQWDDGSGEYAEYYEEDDYGFDDDDYDDGYGGGGYAAANAGNPLAGKSPDEVAQYMNEWLDEGHDKGQIKGLGMQLMKKVL